MSGENVFAKRDSLSALSVSGIQKLQRYVDLVRKWNPAINLVAKSTVDTLWERHVIDSSQVFACIRPQHRRWLDIGSGGGFPGIVVAVLAEELAPELSVVLVESDRRKAVFLSEVARQLDLTLTIKCDRVELLEPQNACVLSARALAPLTQLCGYAERHLAADGVCAFLKGANAADEVSEARKLWKFDLDRVESRTDGRSSILFLRGLCHV